MQQPPSPIAFLRYPITTGIMALAILGTVQFMNSPAGLDLFMSNTGDCVRQPWRLLVPAFFHEGIIHLVFNLYWLWLFGTKIEEELGHVATLGIVVLLGIGSMAAELAIFRGGIGLSGVGYGMFGLLWILGRKDPRFHDTVDHSVVELMLGWLLLCIVLTMADVWHVGNVAHCAGCLLGVLLGWTINAEGFFPRLRNATVLATVFLLFVTGGTIARRYVNLWNDAGTVFADRGCHALESGDPEKAIEQLEQAVAVNPDVYIWWRTLAIAYQRVGEEKKADIAYRNAAAIATGHPLAN
jgi:membrane associated rhomboid family serine protease